MRKKYVLLIFLLSMGSVVMAQTQVRMGFKLSPYWSSNRIDVEAEGVNVQNDGSAIRITLGPVVDFTIDDNENYYFSTGLWLSTRRAGISYQDTGGRITQSYNLQYLVIPVTMKLFTQEVLLDKKIYFQFGPTFDFKVSEKLKDGDKSVRLIDDFRFFDMSLFLSVGMDWHLGNTTRVYGGITYSRGLINAAKNTISELDEMNYKNDLFGIELGVMF